MALTFFVQFLDPDRIKNTMNVTITCVGVGKGSDKNLKTVLDQFKQAETIIRLKTNVCC